MKPYRCRKCAGTDYRLWGKKTPRRTCIACHKRSQLKTYAKHGRKKYRVTEKDKEYRRKWALAKRYGLSPKDYDCILQAQGGGCAICGQHPSASRNLPVDHCHKTGEVRGVLCDPCNVGLSKFKENTRLIAAAYKYLKASEAVDHEIKGPPGIKVVIDPEIKISGNIVEGT